MAYIYPDARLLQNSAKVGTTQCVALVQHYAKAPHTSRWQEGAAVLGNADIKAGTAIATFVHGRYQSLRHGNHAAFFLRMEQRKGVDGFVMMDQWAGDDKARVTERWIPSLKLEPLPGGAYVNASNNADAYAVIE